MSDDPHTMRTDLARVRFLGSARSGTMHMWAMRVTSVALIPLSIAFVSIVVSLIGVDYNGARAVLSSPFPAIVMLLFVLTGIYHMQSGMQTIIEDYVHSETVKTWSLIANLLFCVAIGVACVYAVLKLSFV